jgi:kynureninase
MFWCLKSNLSMQTLSLAQSLDLSDPLAPLKDRFLLPEGVIYLDGNSLGALPKGVAERVQIAIQQEWGVGLIRSWNDADWYPAPLRVGQQIARIVGAQPQEVVACDSTSVNLYKSLGAALKMRPGRKKIVCELGNFPTDAYIVASIAEQFGLEVIYSEQEDVPAAILAAGADLSLVQLTQVNYKTGRVYDMASVTALTHAQGGLIIWDLAHSAGVLDVRLNECKVDFAVGCGYKYLNGGPGAPAFVYVREDLLAGLQQPLTGWHGHKAPFTFSHEYEPHPGIDQMLVGTASQLGLIAFEKALEAYDGVSLAAVRAKSMALGDFFIRLIDEQLAGFDFGLASPRMAIERGSQVALTHPQGYAIMQAVIARGVIGDFRAPNILRFGFAPLYVGFVDIWEAVKIIKEVMHGRLWDRPEYLQQKAVT